MIDVTVGKAIFVFIVAVIAMMLFASATQGFLLTRNKIWESAILLLVAFTLFRPGFWLDRVDPPFNESPPDMIYEVVGQATPDGVLTFVISGPDFDTGEHASTTILVPMAFMTWANAQIGGQPAPPAARPRRNLMGVAAAEIVAAFTRSPPARG